MADPMLLLVAARHSSVGSGRGRTEHEECEPRRPVVKLPARERLSEPTRLE